LRVPLAKVLPFVELADHRPGKSLDDEALSRRFAAAAGTRPSIGAAARQASLFDATDAIPQAPAP